MPITVTCDCGRAYQIASKNAGKKFRCKACGEALVVPKIQSAKRSREESSRDHFDDFGGSLDEYEDYEADEYGSVYDEPTPVSRPRQTRKKSRRKRRGMPPSVVIAVVCEGVLIPFNVLSIIGNLLTLNVGAILVGFIRIALEIAAIKGYFGRDNHMRKMSIILSFVGIFFFGIGLAAVIGNLGGIADVTPTLKAFIVAAIVSQLGIYCVLITVLLLPSSASHFDV